MQRRNVLKAALGFAAVPIAASASQSLALPSTGAHPSLELLSAIQRYESDYNAWVASNDETEENCDGPLYRAFAAAENDLFEFPCRSPADVTAKVRYVFLRDGPQARGAFESIVNDGWEFQQFLNSLLGNEPIVVVAKPEPETIPRKEPEPEPRYNSYSDIPDEMLTEELRQAKLDMEAGFEAAGAAHRRLYSQTKPILDALNAGALA